MKSYLLSSLLALFFSSILFAQNCEPDLLYADSSAGVYPPTIEESACINQGYFFSLTFVIPTTIVLSSCSVTIERIKLEDVEGLPSGMSYGCNPPDCDFMPPGDSIACAFIYGIADDTNTPGEYPLTLVGTVETNFIDVTIEQLLDLLEAESYTLTLEEENSPNCFVTAVHEPLADQISIETSPNPFAANTTVAIQSEISEQLAFQVYNALGQIVHAEKVQVDPGDNIITFDGSHLDNGLYYFHFSDTHSALMQKVLLLK